MKRSIVALFAFALALTACGSQAKSPSIPSASRAPEPSASMRSGPRPVVFDTDMGMDDLLALYVILREPALDVRAIAIDGTGLVHCGPGVANMRRILGAFDRLDIPFGCGRGEPGANGRSFPDEWRASSDLLYGVDLPAVEASELPLDAVTVLHEALAASPEPATVLAVGTWTNLENLFAAHPEDLDRVAGIHTMAGTIDAPGNIELGGTTLADKVEWNVGADPRAFAAVMALDVPVSLVPLDATNDVPVPADIVGTLDAHHAAAGADIAFETYIRNSSLATEGNYWWDATTAVSLVDPGLLNWEDMNITVTTEGSAAGRINRDASGRPVRSAMGADGARVQAAVLDGLRRGAPRPEPFTVTGAISMTWDGTTCGMDGEPPAKAGLVRLDFHNRSTMPVGLLGAGIREPKTWADALAFVAGADFSREDQVTPDWIDPLDGPSPVAEAGKDVVALVALPAGLVGLACGVGEWPDLEFSDGGSFTLTE
jgi:pyrimidine-specific ribonucleoside hydrolase